MLSLGPDDLLTLAKACADRVDLPRQPRIPSLEEVEEQCEEQYETLLHALNQDELFEIDLAAQQRLADRIEAALPADARPLVSELGDAHVRDVWLQQAAAYYVGLAMGLRLAATGPDRPPAARASPPEPTGGGNGSDGPS